jgi:hypothetical protein
MRRVFTIAAVTGIAATLYVPAAGATATGWTPYRTKPFDQTDVCPFPIHGDVVRDEEEVRTDTTYPDGSPRKEEFRGPLVLRLTNTATGRSVVRDVSGYAVLRFAPHGGSTWSFDGGASIGVHAGNRATPPGSYIVHGRFTLRIAADGTRDLRARHASVEDLCTTLA